ncbi:unnamed protein product [Lactuca saligna]|uniref:Reverse transcriptase zinc-binding domain-containing protein n=1 Tax=Lactuca saligna TaxID=75948 RepID=A0AA35Z4H7_LACSI|nr:unnamed protein product [Lactuca saligna]
MMVGNGRTTRFWLDTWIGNIPLKDRFSRLFYLEQNRNCSIAERWEDGWYWLWNCNFETGALQSQFEDLLLLIRSFQPNLEEDDWCWELNGALNFNVNEVRKHIDNECLPDGTLVTRWNHFVPRKVENAYHVFFLCEEVYVIWQRVFRWVTTVIIVWKRLVGFSPTSDEDVLCRSSFALHHHYCLAALQLTTSNQVRKHDCTATTVTWVNNSKNNMNNTTPTDFRSSVMGCLLRYFCSWNQEKKVFRSDMEFYEEFTTTSSLKGNRII